MLKGLIVKSVGSTYAVEVNGEIKQATLRGKLRLKDKQATNPIAVGDWVEVEPGEDWVIHQILDRKNKISRKSSRNLNHEHVIAANIDQVIIITSIVKPQIKFNFIDRCLVASEVFRLPAHLIVTKTDLLKNEELLSHITDIYRDSFQSIHFIALNENPIVPLETISLFQNKISVLTGQSGVGKSSIVKFLNPNLSIRIGETSKKWEQGVHTTSNAELFPIGNGTYVIDTPGLKEFSLYDLEPHEISYYFKDIAPFISDCKFSKCLHVNEPNCAVKDAVEAEKIHPMRYESYVQMIQSIEVESTSKLK